MNCINAPHWLWAFYVTMAAVGMVSCGFTAIVLGRCLYLDIRRLIAKRRWQERAVSRSNVISIGYSPNRRRHPDGFFRTN